MKYEYNIGEIYVCAQCGMRVIITQAANPIQELTCCDKIMELKKDASDKEDDNTVQNTEYKVGQIYTCPVCALGCKILSSGKPSKPLSCCGVPMV